MKCSFCGKELEKDAEFCPECGMILSLGDIDSNDIESENSEIPEFTPNVFKGMDFEQEVQQPAVELEVEDKEEIAPVVEAIPEYVPEAAKEEVKEEVIVEDGFAAPEYDPKAEVASEDALAAAVREAQAADIAATGFAPPVYDNTPINIEPQPVVTEQKTVMIDPEEARRSIEQAEAKEREVVAAQPEVKEPTYPEFKKEAAETKRTAMDDDSLIEALFDSVTTDDDDDYEDITETYNEPKKKTSSSNKGYAMVFLLVAVLVGIIFATGHIVNEVLPSVREKESNETIEEVDGTYDEYTDYSEYESSEEDSTTEDGTKISSLPGLMTTTGSSTSSSTSESSTSSTTSGFSTTTSSSTSSTTAYTTSTTSPITTTNPTTTTRPSYYTTTTTTNPSYYTTTTRPSYYTTTTSPYNTTTKQSYTFNANAYVQKPASYNIDQKTVYPDVNAILLKSKPASSSDTLYTLSYGYPLTAYAEENGYYYVLSIRYGIYGWVRVSDVYEKDTPQTTTKPQTTTQGTTSATTTTTSGSDKNYTKYATAYKAVINSSYGLNFRKGPGTNYGISAVIPGGYYVTVYGYSASNPDWVYVTVTDSKYPYGNPSGWVHSDYLK